MRKLTALLLFALLISPAALFAAERSFKITTYYPAPYGEYKEVKTTDLQVRTQTAPKVDQVLAAADTEGNVKWTDAGGGGKIFHQPISVVPTAYVPDYTDVITISKTFPRGKYFSVFTATWYTVSCGSTIGFKLLVDGEEKDQFSSAAIGNCCASAALSHVGDFSSEGTHTIKVQAVSSNWDTNCKLSFNGKLTALGGLD